LLARPRSTVLGSSRSPHAGTSDMRLGRQPADHSRSEREMLRVRIPPEPFSSRTPSRSSQECSPPCQGGDHGFKSHRGRCGSMCIRSARYANRQSGQAQTLVICGFDSLSCHCFGWCSSRRPVKPLPSNCVAVGERFNSFTTHFLSGPVVYWPGHHPLKVEKGVRLPSGLIPYEKENGLWLVLAASQSGPKCIDCLLPTVPRRGRCPIGSHKADLPGSIPGPGTLRAGWCSAEFHKLGGRGSNPGPANRSDKSEVTGWHGTRTGIAVRSRI
jgi:hypothetical protein